MYIQYDKRNVEVSRFASFTKEKIEYLIAIYGEEKTSAFLERLESNGKAYIRTNDPNDTGILFEKTGEGLG